MITRKDKKDIVNIIINEFNYNQIQNLKDCFDGLKFDEKIRIHKWSGNIHNDKIKLNGYHINKVLKLPILNDAPRMGMEGDYILVKGTKANKEILGFIKSFLDIY